MSSIERSLAKPDVSETGINEPLVQFEQSLSKQQKAIWADVKKTIEEYGIMPGGTQVLLSNTFSRLYAVCESLRLDLPQKQIGYAWDYLEKQGIWLAQTTEVDGMPVRIFSLLDQLRKSMPTYFPKRPSSSLYRLDRETFQFLVSTFDTLITDEHEKGIAENPTSATQLLMQLFKTSKKEIRQEFILRRPVVFSRGLSNEQKKSRQQGHMAVLSTIEDFGSMALWHVSDPDSQYYASSRRFVERLSHRDSFAIAPSVVDRTWIRQMVRLSKELADPWYGTIVGQTIGNLRQQESGRFLFAHDVSELLPKTDFPVRMVAFFRLAQAFSERIGTTVTLHQSDVPQLNEGFVLHEATVVVRPLLYEAQCFLQLSTKENNFKQTVRLAAYYKNLQGPTVLFDVLDEEQISEETKNAALRFIYASISRAMSKGRHEAAQTIPSGDTGLQIPAVLEKRRYAKEFPKETKRPKKPKNRTVPAEDARNDTAAGNNHYLQPSISQREFKKIRRVLNEQFDDHIAGGILQDVRDYQVEKLGRFKILKHYTGPEGGHMFSLRCSRIYRMLFEVGPENRLTFMSIVHRKELFQALERFREKR